VYCPRCGFRSEREPGREGCPRCGPSTPLAISKRARPAPRAPLPATRSSHSSLKLALALLTLAVAVLGFFATKRTEREPSPIPSSDAPPVEALDAGPELAPPVPSTPIPTPTLENGAPVPRLPELSSATVSAPLLARAKELARDHPGEEWLREYVVNLHFWLAVKSMEARRYDEAERYLDDSEEWAAPAGEVAGYRAVLFRNEELWATAESWARRALASGSTTDPAEMHHIIGKAYYFREEVDRAIEEFRAGLAIREAPHIRASLELAERDARTSDGFSRQRLSHFIVRYEGETMEDTGRMALDQLERNYASLISQLGFEPREPVPVVLYTRRSYLEIGGSHWSGGQFDGKIRLPVRGIHWGEDYIRRTLHHELAHAFYYSLARGHDPRWLNEGLAEYVVGERSTTVGARLAPYVHDGDGLERCLLSQIYDCPVFYPASASLVDYLIQMRGMGGIRDVVTHLGEGETTDEALGKVLGRDERQFLRDWEHFLRRRM
jgi:tetratricopeptide (TPR) repeat protein